jgi:hypothetical protein
LISSARKTGGGGWGVETNTTKVHNTLQTAENTLSFAHDYQRNEESLRSLMVQKFEAKDLFLSTKKKLLVSLWPRTRFVDLLTSNKKNHIFGKLKNSRIYIKFLFMTQKVIPKNERKKNLPIRVNALLFFLVLIVASCAI